MAKLSSEDIAVPGFGSVKVGIHDPGPMTFPVPVTIHDPGPMTFRVSVKTRPLDEAPQRRREE